MNKRMLIIIFLGLSLSALLTWNEAVAQERNTPGQMRNLRRNLVTLRALRMTQALELSEEQTAAIFPELSRAEKDKAELQRQLAEEIRNLREKVNSEKTSDGEFEAGVQKIRELRQKIQAREQAFEEFLFSRLTAVQKARYIIFSLDFNRVIMERANRLRLSGQKNK